MNFLEKLRKKDKSKKDSFAFITSFFITLFIFAIWLLTTVYNFSDTSSENVASPFDVFTNQIKTFFVGSQTYNAEN